MLRKASKTVKRVWNTHNRPARLDTGDDNSDDHDYVYFGTMSFEKYYKCDFKTSNGLTCACWTTFSRRCLAAACEQWAWNCITFYKILMTVTHDAGVLFWYPLRALLIELHFMIAFSCFRYGAVSLQVSAARDIIVWVLRQAG